MLRRKTLAVLLVALFVLTLLPASALAAAKLPEGVTESTFGANTVYYNGGYYETLTAALNAVYKSSPTETAIVYCKPGSDVGVMTHGHVADNLIIYGNGAYVSGGEYDLEIDTYKYDRTTGQKSDTGDFLTGNIRVEVHDLDGIAAWGQRNTAHTIDLVFTNCKNMNRIYFTNTANKEGSINVTLNNCSFNANEGSSNANTSVYSNAPGTIAITDTTFTGIAVGLNINHKSAGVQNITLTNCIFTDCALEDSAQAASTKTYGAPVRVVAAEGATTNLTVTNAQFVYSQGKNNVGNGDILIGDGRYDAVETQGVVTLAMTGTQAQVAVQKAGYYTDADGNNPVNAANMAVTPVLKTDVLEANEGSHFVVKAPQQPQAPEEKPDVPETGDRGILLWAATLVTLGGVCAGLVLRRRRAVR